MKRLLVTGARDWADVDVVRTALLEAFVELSDGTGEADVMLVSGHCPTGADWIAENVWEELFDPYLVDRHPADWDKFGKAAGPIRNSEMVGLGADLCLAFVGPKSRGTVDCAAKAEAAGITVRRFYA